MCLTQPLSLSFGIWTELCLHRFSEVKCTKRLRPAQMCGRLLLELTLSSALPPAVKLTC